MPASATQATPPNTDSDPLALTRLDALMAATEGDPDLVVGVIDGRLASDHDDLRGARVRTVAGDERGAACQLAASLACDHGTFVAGMLSARRGGRALGICPGCSLVWHPIFCEAGPGEVCPTVEPEELASAITETIDAGARILNLSLGLGTTSLSPVPRLTGGSSLAGRCRPGATRHPTGSTSYPRS